VRIRDEAGWRAQQYSLPPWTSMLGAFSDPATAPEMLALRETMRSWRFYDHVRTDQAAPARQSIIGTRTPVLASDGSDLAAAIQSIREMGHAPDLDAAIERALPGSRVEIDARAGRFALLLHQGGLLRPLEAAELSDGTLRYLLWVAALLSPRPAALLVLNEPETSLHPSLLEPLAELVVRASASSQVIVVTHSCALVDALHAAGAVTHVLEKDYGETLLAGQDWSDAPSWVWPKR